MIDLVEDDMRPYIHPHWAKFPAVHPYYSYFYASFYAWVFLFGCAGNLVVILMFTFEKSLKSPINKYFVNLAVSDLGMLMSQYPPYSYNVFYGASWQFGPLACTLNGTAANFFAVCSLVTITAMLYERSKVIAHGVPPEQFTNGKAFFSILLIWLYSVFFSSGPYFGFGRYVPEGSLEMCGFDFMTQTHGTRFYFWGFILTNYAMPFLISTTCMSMIVSSSMRHNRIIKLQAAKMNMSSLRCNQRHEYMKEEIRNGRICVAIGLVWFWVSTPYLFLRFQGIMGDHESITPLRTLFLSLYAKSSTLISPIVISLFHRKYRAAVKKHLPWFLTWFIEPQNKTYGDMTVGSIGSTRGEST